jgi:putative endonuclease
MESSRSPLQIGQDGERIAEEALKRQGYRILERNHRNRIGEIDLIAEEGDELVFVEVKTRRPGEIGNPAEFVDLFKQSKLARTALGYLSQKRLDEAPCRFDVVCVTPLPDGDPQVEIIRSAFVVE